MKSIFYLLVLLLPTQLGRHFWPNFSFIQGIRVDYLSPTFYLTDLLIILLILTSSYFAVRRIKFPKIGAYWKWGLLILFFLIGIYFSQSPPAGILGLVRFAEFSFLGFYIAKTITSQRQVVLIGSLLGVGIIGESFLAIWQFANQSSVGGIFWFLGERTFSSQTPGIAQAVIDGQLILRPYGTFPHPNVLAGFLLVAMALIILNTKKIFLVTALVVGTSALFLTMSRVAILIWLFILALFGIAQFKKYLKNKFAICYLLFAIFIVSLSYFSPIFSRFTSLSLGDEAVMRRGELTVAAVEMIKAHPLTGVGLNNFLVNLSYFQQTKSTILYLQPVHNIYLLVAAETGIIGLGFFLWFMGKTYQKVKGPLFIALTAILILGLFDHYFLTLQQGQLLFSLILGLSWAKIKRRYEPPP